ncbi:unnamed protein product [Cuscuta europaea]|uniref:Uncharacterized protein n=1 Tax=Cuscuta europaea TaxID=41803 RepID=A0A9P0YW59_CUSEU|nr:unnamed protein product [Cuscuta europaea]
MFKLGAPVLGKTMFCSY